MILISTIILSFICHLLLLLGFLIIFVFFFLQIYCIIIAVVFCSMNGWNYSDGFNLFVSLCCGRCFCCCLFVFRKLTVEFLRKRRATRTTSWDRKDPWLRTRRIPRWHMRKVVVWVMDFWHNRWWEIRKLFQYQRLWFLKKMFVYVFFKKPCHVMWGFHERWRPMTDEKE